MAKITFALGSLSRTTISKIIDNIDQASQHVIDDFVELTPEFTGAMKGSWYKTTPVFNGNKITWTVGNRDPFSLQKVVGRGPGGLTPVLALLPWVEQQFPLKSDSQALGLSFAIAKTHAKAGSFNFRRKENSLGLTLQGEIIPGKLADTIINSNYIQAIGV